MNERIEAVLDGTSNGCIICGDWLDIAPTMPDGCVDMCVTSPPYWGLRDYGVDGQIGLEATPELFVAKMVEVFAQVKRVLADHGTLWLNLGDSYANDTKWGGRSGKKNYTSAAGGYGGQRTKRNTGLKPKDLCGMPWRVALALQADGWTLRSDIIWHKPNPMPESCRDRPTKAHEYLFQLTKRPKYFYDAEAVKEGVTGNAHVRGDGVNPKAKQRAPGSKQNASFSGAVNDLVGTRNKRSVWTIATESCSEAHFATYPTKLVEPCIMAGTSARGYCPQCGKPWVRVVQRERAATRPGHNSKVYVDPGGSPYEQHAGSIVGNRDPKRHCSVATTLGWEPTCGCNAAYPDCETATDDPAFVPYEPRPGIVLDPFGGSGTTGIVAGRLKRNYVLIDLNPEYVEEVAKPRLAHVETAVPVKEAARGQLGLFEPATKEPAPAALERGS